MISFAFNISLKEKGKTLTSNVRPDRSVAKSADKSLELARLMREAQVNNTIYMMLREKFEENRIVEAGQIGSVRIVDRAKPPKDPIKPKKKMNLLLGKTNRGELEFRVKEVAGSAELLYALGHQILYGLFCMVSGGIAYISYLRDETYLIRWFGGASAFFVVCLLGSMLRVRQRRRKRR